MNKFLPGARLGFFRGALALVLFLSSSLLHAADTTPVPVDKADAKNLEITLVPDKTTLMSGESLFVNLTVKNISGTPLYYGPFTSFSVSGTIGQNVPDLYDGQQAPTLIPSHGQITRRLFIERDYRHFTSPGDYVITASSTLQTGAGFDNSYDGDSKIGVMGTAKITVVPADPEKMGAIIDDLKAQLLRAKFQDNSHSKRWTRSDLSAAQSEALQLLESIPDERLIPLFIELLHSSDLTGIGVLSKFNNDQALEVINARAKVTARDVLKLHPGFSKSAATLAAANSRRDAASALLTSVHPRAADCLLAMRHDPYDQVRAEVLRMLPSAQVPPEKAIPILQEMARDKAQWIGAAAKEHLSYLLKK